MADIQFFSCDNGLSDICFRMLDGFSHGVAFGKIGGNSGREGASRSMQIMAFYFGGGEQVRSTFSGYLQHIAH